MSDTEAKITITAEDKASPAVQQAAQSFQNLRGTLVDIGPYMDGTYKNFDALGNVIPEATSAVGGFNLGNIAMIATGVSVANVLQPMVSGFKEFAMNSLEAAGTLEAVHNRATVIFGSDLPSME